MRFQPGYTYTYPDLAAIHPNDPKCPDWYAQLTYPSNVLATLAKSYVVLSCLLLCSVQSRGSSQKGNEATLGKLWMLGLRAEGRDVPAYSGERYRTTVRCA